MIHTNQITTINNEIIRFFGFEQKETRTNNRVTEKKHTHTNNQRAYQMRARKYLEINDGQLLLLIIQVVKLLSLLNQSVIEFICYSCYNVIPNVFLGCWLFFVKHFSVFACLLMCCWLQLKIEIERIRNE